MSRRMSGDDGAAALATRRSTSHPIPPAAGQVRPHLDRDRIRAGIARRRQALAGLEAALVAACEQAAARGARSCVRIDDRATWDRAMWQRYLDAAARLEPDYGPGMRRLLREIDQLTRLMALPVAG
jgi:hypothetical protein